MGSGAGASFEPARRVLRDTADASLARWVAALAADDAARQRARDHWLAQAAREEGTFAGVLADLAERRRPVLVRLHSGRVHRGVARVIGRDFAVLGTATGSDVLVALAAIASIRTLPDEPETIGDRVLAPDTSLLEALSGMVDERPRVLVVGFDADHAVTGELRSIGRDVITVRLDGAGGTAYVAVGSIAEIALC